MLLSTSKRDMLCGQEGRGGGGGGFLKQYISGFCAVGLPAYGGSKTMYEL